MPHGLIGGLANARKLVMRCAASVTSIREARNG
jgi:hypothetical protein